MLIRRRLVGVRLFPTGQIPDFEAAAISHQGYFAFQTDFLTGILGQNESSLPVGPGVLGAGMELAEKDAAIPRSERSPDGVLTGAR